MSPLAALAFQPAWALAFAVGFVALRLGRARGVGLAALCFTQGIWITGLLLFVTPGAVGVAERVLPAGILEAAGFVHAAADLEATPAGTPDRSKLVKGAWASAGVVALLGALQPRLLYGPGASGAGPLFLPLAAVATLATAGMLLWVARCVRRSSGSQRRRFLALGVGALLGSLGGGGTVGLFVTGMGPAWIAAPLMFGSIALAAFALLDRETGPGFRLVRAGLVYALITAAISAFGLTAYAFLLPHLVPTSASVWAVYGWAALITFFATLPLDPLRSLLVEGIGRRVMKDPIGVRDLADAVEKTEVRADQSERLAELGAVVGAVAHEIRNPLGVLLVQAKLLERDGAPAERVQTIREQVARAKRFVDDLLLYGKPRPLALERASVLEIVERAALQARASFGEGAAEVAVGGDASVEADVDRVALADVIEALLGNALAAVEEAPPVDDAARSIAVEVSRGPAGGARISVDDDGPGVPDVIADRLFDPFVTGRGRDAKRPGTGLGLAIAKRWVERHGGDLVHERSKRGGARFVIDLPRR